MDECQIGTGERDFHIKRRRNYMDRKLPGGSERLFYMGEPPSYIDDPLPRIREPDFYMNRALDYRGGRRPDGTGRAARRDGVPA
jgi:hypothetical protein